MICQNCQQDVDEQEVKAYIFYYGNQTGRTPHGFSSSARYKIVGTDKPFLCDNCVFSYAMQRRAAIYRGWSIFFALVGCTLGLVTLLGSDGTTGALPWLIAGLALAYAIALFAMGAIEKRRIENRDFVHLSTALRSMRGSNLAIAARQDDWQEKGYSAFFTPQRMKKLNHLRAPARR